MEPTTTPLNTYKNIFKMNLEKIREIQEGEGRYINARTGDNSVDSQILVTLCRRGRNNVFAMLPQIMQEMIEAEERSRNEDRYKPIEVLLPSEAEFKNKMYNKLVENKRKQLQEMSNENDPDTEMPTLGNTIIAEYKQEPEKRWQFIPPDQKNSQCNVEMTNRRRSSLSESEITWSIVDIGKAARLLNDPPLGTDFEDEEEMRRVYTLIYDVFRHKTILNEALRNVGFFSEFSHLKHHLPKVWLLLYDLYHRQFKDNEAINTENGKKIYQTCDLNTISQALWNFRIRIAAAIAKLRIKNNALKLSDMLPPYLRDDRLQNGMISNPVTCWVNANKVKSAHEIIAYLRKALSFKQMANGSTMLSPNNFKWDLVCPQFITFHPASRALLSQSVLVKQHKLIVQDKSFCIGPAAFCKMVNNLQLTGNVIQTHINSPRTTAYLANVLLDNEKITNVFAFSAGTRKKEYEEYFESLGIKNIQVFSEKFIDLPLNTDLLEQVIAVFATPPNSYSAVNDPIDLVCSRGGDLAMLEVLTESEITNEGRKRVARILEEQRVTLKQAMSRPQIQFVLYETHSQLDIENESMVKRVALEINNTTKLKHALLQGKPTSLSVDFFKKAEPSATNTEINNNEKIMDNAELPTTSDDVDKTEILVSRRDSTFSRTSVSSTKNTEHDLNIPDTDVFEISKLPPLCLNEDYCVSLPKEGCYLALLQRKQISRMDNKYMIEEAEARGVFGNSSTSSNVEKTKSGKLARQKEKENKVVTPKKFKKRVSVEWDRISAPTQASLMRSRNLSQSSTIYGKPPDEGDEEEIGLRICQKQFAQNKVPIARRWWTETSRHLTTLRKSLIHQKLIPPPALSTNYVQSHPDVRQNARVFVNTTLSKTKQIDEIVATKTKANSNIPVFPRLKLPRPPPKRVKRELPIFVTFVTFPKKSCLQTS